MGSSIPDNDSVGVTDTRNVSGTGITNIQLVTITLDTTGGWNGDLYAYLVHDTGFSVLLNRAGRTLAALDGSASSGMSITFDDAAAADVHTAIPMAGGSVTATYQPDGRDVDPLVVFDTTPRSAFMSSFNGLSAEGVWTLFIADQSAGSVATATSWTLTITGIPEPGTAVLALLAVLPLLRRRSAVRLPHLSTL
jgi:hypothetical protein